MIVYLMRHFTVSFNWKKIYNSFEFDSACEVYDNSVIIPETIKFMPSIKSVYISTLPRAEETFESLGLKSKPIKTFLLDEVPLKSFIKTKFKIPLFLWLFIGRMEWLLNIGKGEKRADTKKRINSFISLMEEKNQDCLVIGHGFYFFWLKKELKRKQYLGMTTFHHKNGEVVPFSKML